MITLALDTSTPVASVALSVDDEVYERAEQVTTFSERLMAMIDELFTEAGVRPSSLNAVVCGAGPGSFTGLRMGLSTAKGLCLGTGCRLLLISSLEALAAQVPGGTVLAAVDAFRGEIYAALYRDGVEVKEPFSALPAVLHATTATHAIGDAFAKYPDACPPGAVRIDSAPRARDLLVLARARTGSDDPRTAAPRYVRASAPEEAASKRT
jgi:tRNA threonylcarbamoyladenosine biosynthesis protein TsaB